MDATGITTLQEVPGHDSSPDITWECRNCGPLPVEAFHIKQGAPMVICKKCHTKRVYKAQKTRKAAYRESGLKFTSWKRGSVS